MQYKHAKHRGCAPAVPYRFTKTESFAGIGPAVKERAKAIVPFLLAAATYTQLAHLPLEQILNGAIAAVLFNIIYDTLLSRKLRWFALCPVIDSMNHQSTSTVCPPCQVAKLDVDFDASCIITHAYQPCLLHQTSILPSYDPPQEPH